MTYCRELAVQEALPISQVDPPPLLRMDNSRMNSFLEYTICNRGTNAYSPKAGYPHLDQAFSGPFHAGHASDSYNADGRLYVGGSNQPAAAQHQHQSTVYAHHQHQTHQSGIGLSYAGTGTTSYGTQACANPDYAQHQYFINPEQDGMYYHPSGWFSNSKSVLTMDPRPVRTAGRREAVPSRTLPAPWCEGQDHQRGYSQAPTPTYYRPPKGGKGDTDQSPTWEDIRLDESQKKPS